MNTKLFIYNQLFLLHSADTMNIMKFFI